MSYQLKVIKDYPIGFWPLDESSGTNAADISGCGNNGTYVGSPTYNMLPLIPGGVSGTKITNTAYVTLPTSKDFYGSTVSNGLGNKYSSDNDFTLEVWISPSIQSSSQTTIFADITNNIGLFWEKNDIVFKISSTEKIRWAVPYTKKAIHVVGIYSVDSIKLFIDGKQVAIKSIDTSFRFTNSSFLLQVGPTSDAGDSFVVDAPAVYRYSLLDAAVLRHFNDANFYIQPIHVVTPESGLLFSCSDNSNRIDFEYTYGISRDWKELLDANTYYDEQKRYVSFVPTETVTSRSLVINDFIFIPTQSGLTNSKIEWRNDYGITVETSIDGTNYVACLNGKPVPQYKKGAFNSSGILHIRITMATTDASKFLPRLSFFSIKFYRESLIYSDNSNGYISSSNQFSIGSVNYSPIIRHYDNGIRPDSGSGFNLNTELSTVSLEMFFTPKTTGETTLFYDPTTLTKYSWNASGTVSKASISALYVNGVDRSTATNISSFLVAGEPHHIVLVFTSAVTGALRLNYQTSGGGPDNLYNNIALYSRALTESEADTHFDLYCGRPATVLQDPSITLTESAPQYYDNDWIVLQSI